MDFLEKVVLGELRRLMRFAREYEDEFAKIVMGHSRNAIEFDRQRKAKELSTMAVRIDEIDGLYEKMYEDNVGGKLSDERFYKMSKRYEDEQAALNENIKRLKSEIGRDDDKETTADMFMSTVRKYTRTRKLTPRMLNELIEKIEVYQAERLGGEYVQKLTVHSNCVGAIEMPEISALKSPEVRIMTRKGIAVNYVAAQNSQSAV
jgi:hypothetical protein